MKAIGIILAGGKNEKLEKLTSNRVTSAIPIASNFRAIDFSLSNMSNSGINSVAIITQYNSRSLHDHLASSKWWNFGRKQRGLFIFTPYLGSNNSFWFRGTADSIYQNRSFLKKSNEEYVVICNGDCIYKMDYSDVIKYHVEKDADITVVCKDIYNEDLSHYGVVKLDEDNRIIDFNEKPLDPETNTISIAVYVIKRTLLIELLSKLNDEGRYDLVIDLIIRYRNRLKIMAYKYNDNYWKAVNSVNSYFDANMDFLKKEVRQYFNNEKSVIFTKAKDLPPVKYNYNANVKNCSIGNGSIISGSVDNSVIFRDVKIGEGSSVSYSIIMESSKIENDCYLEYVILDKNVIIKEGTRLIGTHEKPIIIGKSSIVGV